MDLSTSKSVHAASMSHRIVMDLSQSSTSSASAAHIPPNILQAVSTHLASRSPSSISGNNYELKAVVRIHSMRVASLTLCNVSTVHVDLSIGDHV